MSRGRASGCVKSESGLMLQLTAVSIKDNVEAEFSPI